MKIFSPAATQRQTDWLTPSEPLSSLLLLHFSPLADTQSNRHTHRAHHLQLSSHTREGNCVSPKRNTHFSYCYTSFGTTITTATSSCKVRHLDISSKTTFTVSLSVSLCVCAVCLNTAFDEHQQRTKGRKTPKKQKQKKEGLCLQSHQMRQVKKTSEGEKERCLLPKRGPPFSHDVSIGASLGVNLARRTGALIFVTGALVHLSLKVSQRVHYHQHHHCRRPTSLAIS